MEAGATRRTGRPTRWAGTCVLIIAACCLLAAGVTDGLLHWGPARAATFGGKRIAGASSPVYRAMYSYDNAGRLAADTDEVDPAFYHDVHVGVPLRVRSVGFGAYRVARLDGASTRGDDLRVAARWAAIGIILLAVACDRVIRRRHRGLPR